jgi:hypothetical protein
MATVARIRPPVKTDVQASLSEHDGLTVLILTVLTKYRPRTDLYFLTRLPCVDVAYRLRKVDASRDGADHEEAEYHVNLTEARCGCSCKGYLAHGHCKHYDGLSRLWKEGALTPSARPCVLSCKAPLRAAWTSFGYTAN